MYVSSKKKKEHRADRIDDSTKVASRGFDGTSWADDQNELPDYEEMLRLMHQESARNREHMELILERLSVIEAGSSTETTASKKRTRKKKSTSRTPSPDADRGRKGKGKVVLESAALTEREARTGKEICPFVHKYGQCLEDGCDLDHRLATDFQKGNRQVPGGPSNSNRSLA